MFLFYFYVFNLLNIKIINEIKDCKKIIKKYSLKN